jgi:hypothetical protein
MNIKMKKTTRIKLYEEFVNEFLVSPKKKIKRAIVIPGWRVY